MRRLLICGLAASLAAPAYAGAVRPAADIADVYETTVGYADLDLDQPAGADRLLVRIRLAAQAVCGQPVSPRDMATEGKARRACIAAATAGAVGKVGWPLVTARYERSKSAPMLAAR